MNFKNAIATSLEGHQFKIEKIEYNKNSHDLKIDIMAKEFIPQDKIDTLKRSLKTELKFINHLEVGVLTSSSENELKKEGVILEEEHFTPQIETNANSTFIKENWENILSVVKRKNPAMASILNRSKIEIENTDVEITFDDEALENTFYYYETEALINNICKQNLNQTVDISTKSLLGAHEGVEAFNSSQEAEMKIMVETATQNFDPSKTAMPSEHNNPSKPFNRKKGNGKSPEENIKRGILYRNKISKKLTPIIDIDIEEETYAIEGKVVAIDSRELKGGKYLFKLYMSDLSNAICCKCFLKKTDFELLIENIKENEWLIVEGVNRYDTFDREKVLFINAINQGKVETARLDRAIDKRVELHMHTNMSEMDGITSVKTLIKTAKKWGHKSIAITDHGGLQAFPDASNEAGDDIKVIYGVEGYLIDDVSPMIKNATSYTLDETYVVYDIETTGFSYNNDKIIEIGAVKICNNQVVERFSEFVNPERVIPNKIVELTQINDDMVKDADIIENVLPRFMQFVGDNPVVAHNAKFDCSFIRYNCDKLGLPFNNLILDTLALSRLLLTSIKKHNLKAVTKHLKITLDGHHRAVVDAEATAFVLLKFFTMLKEKEVDTLEQINQYAMNHFDFKMLDVNHIIILAQNYIGLKNLYELVSDSNINHYYRKPRISKRLLMQKRQGLILGSACESGELYKGIMNNLDKSEIIDIATFYDYLEIQPTGNNEFMVENGRVRDICELQDINKCIIDIGDQLGKLVVATCDVHFLNPEDEVYRRILMSGSGYRDADNQAPLYFRTTEEMLEEFSYLGERAEEIVITNTNKIADRCERILPVPKGTFPPSIEGADEEFRDMCWIKAKRIYGDPVPEIVSKRLDRELTSIIGNGYAVMYIIAQKLVSKSLEDGFLVGSRGSVGSSFAATMSDITEVNPLPPHYICKKCTHSEFIVDGTYGSGVDMPDKNCPNCGSPYFKDGYDIPFETFLGFDGDKEPDIDLNFAGIYQANAHKYCEVLFGTGKTFKAGTIGTIADKTAYGYVKKYFEERNQEVHRYEIERLSKGLTGIKRTSGQHPGGIMVVPADHDIHEFTPIQYPANDASSGVVTTHFDYHSISGRLLKLDILGHDVPTIIKYLEELTGVDVFSIPLGDPKTMSIFTSVEALDIVEPGYNIDIGSLGIPEFGTKFVRQMLRDTQPKTFSDLVRISGLSHGTDVWVNNAQDLVRNNTVTIKDVIATRDDIMNYLIHMGLEPLSSFKIMEDVRKGKGLKGDYISEMKEQGVPDWYINSCQTIQYMFPKAHAVAYVMMSVRIAYFKVHHPLAFYATYFMTKVDDFDAELICKGIEVVKAKMKEIENMEKPTKKEQDLLSLLEIVCEMYSRGLSFKKVDLYESDASKFKIIDGKILPPFLGVQGVGATAAQSIVDSRTGNDPFLSIEDFRMRTKVSKTVIEAMRLHGCFDNLPEDNQLSLFSFA